MKRALQAVLMKTASLNFELSESFNKASHLSTDINIYQRICKHPLRFRARYYLIVAYHLHIISSNYTQKFSDNKKRKRTKYIQNIYIPCCKQNYVNISFKIIDILWSEII